MDLTQVRERIGKRHYAQDVAAGISLSRSGFYGVDFVRCGNVRIEKRKRGFLTFGGMNVVVLDDLSVVLPPKEPLAGEVTGSETKTTVTDGVPAQQVLSGLGIEKSFLHQYLGGHRRFSGLRINGLSVACLDARTNVVPCVVAKMGEAVRDGLALTDCGVITNGKTNLVGRATLNLKPELKVVWSGGEKRFY